MSEPESVPGFGDIGARLRRARERVGMTPAQAAERLHCDLGLIESLEAGRFAQIGAPVFVRGHLRRYAELLGEPVGEILEAWEREAAGHLAQPDLTRIPKAKRRSNTRRLLVAAAAATLVALFVVLIYWVLNDASLTEIGRLGALPAPEASAPGAGPTVSAILPEAPGSGVDSEESTGEETGQTMSARPEPPAAPLPQSAAPRGAANDTNASAPREVSVAAGTLRIRAAEDCWIEIYDAERRRLYFNLLRAGSSTSVRGRLPLRVLLGNVRGVALEFDGRPLGVPMELQRANTANLLLGADGALRAAPLD